jgi:hypothetical protein
MLPAPPVTCSVEPWVLATRAAGLHCALTRHAMKVWRYLHCP